MKKQSKKITDDLDALEIDVTFDDVDLNRDLLVASSDQDECFELSDADFVLLDTSSSPAPLSHSALRAVLTTPRPPSSISPASPSSDSLLRLRSERPRRRISSWDKEAESDVADECLATIAAEASRTRASDPFLSNILKQPIAIAPPSSSAAPFTLSQQRSILSQARDRLARRGASDREDDSQPLGSADLLDAPPSSSSLRSLIPPPSSSVVASAKRLPPISMPPFRSPFARRAGLSPFSRIAPDESVDDIVETLPVPLRAFTRTAPDTATQPGVVTPAAPASEKKLTTTRKQTPSGSVAPVALGSTERTVIVRDRQRTAWVIASAAVGALVAVTAMRFLMPSSSATTQATEGAAVQPIAATPIIAPTTHTVVFSEADGVSIKVPSSPIALAPSPPPHANVATTTPAAPASTPAATAARPTTAVRVTTSKPAPKVSPPISMPDGSLGLANNNSTTTSSTANTNKTTSAPPIASSAMAPTTSAPRKHPLTPEQELAEAQLRAALR